MANTTVRDATSIHGTNPQNLIEATVRYRIYDSLYWKEHCFALTAESIIDEAVKLPYIGGTYANQRPTEFICLALKLLQLQPDREIVLEYLRAEEFKYLRALAAFYIRLTFDSLNAYELLESLLDDYRKIRVRNLDGSFSLSTMDQFADELLNEERVCEIQLPRLTLRTVLETSEGLPERKSKLAKALGLNLDRLHGKQDTTMDKDSDAESDMSRYISRSPSPVSDNDASSESGSDAGWHTGKRYVSPTPSDDSQKDDQDDQVHEQEQDRYISRSPSPASDAPYRSPTPDHSDTSQ